MRDQLYISLDLLANLPNTVVNNVGEQVILGLVSLTKSHRNVIRYVHIRSLEIHTFDPL